MFYRIANIIGGGIPTWPLTVCSPIQETGQHLGDRIPSIGLYLNRLRLYHLWALPKPADDKKHFGSAWQVSVAEVVREFFCDLRAFFTKKILVSRLPSFCCSA